MIYGKLLINIARRTKVERSNAIKTLESMRNRMNIFDTIAPTEERKKAIDLAIVSLKTDETYNLMYEHADVQEVVHARWIKHPDELFPMESTQTCSNCNQSEFIFISNDNYCPNCGAKMDLEEENGKIAGK
jgi:rubrerythrin